MSSIFASSTFNKKNEEGNNNTALLTFWIQNKYIVIS